jgi:hypothetical protein
MKLRTLLEEVFYTKPGTIIVGGIFVLALGLATSNEAIIYTGCGFLIFGGIIGMILIWEILVWKKVETRHRENLSMS